MDQLNGGLKDIFSTILNDQTDNGGRKNYPSIIVLNGNGNVIAPGGTVHVVHALPGTASIAPPGPLE